MNKIALHSGIEDDPLPAADNSGTLNLAMTSGKAALVNLTTALSGECPDDSSIVDFVGYGSAATCHWGNGNAPTLNNAPQKSLARLDDGCRSLRDNASDFEKGSVSPRNSATTSLTCNRWRLTESTALFYDGWELNAEADAQTGNVTAVYLHGANTDELIARADVSNANATNAVVYYTYDHLGSVRALSNTAGNIVESYQYEAFGKPTVFDASGNKIARSAFGNRFMFTGREYLGTIQLYDYRNRTYSPKWGRFIEVDPIRFEGRDLNLYRYVGNRADIWTDPEGEFVRAWIDFWENYQKMKEANTIGADKYFYCMANCEASSHDDLFDFFDELAAEVISELREWYGEYLKGDPPEDCDADREANHHGQNVPEGVKCEDWCAQFRPEALSDEY